MARPLQVTSALLQQAVDAASVQRALASRAALVLPRAQRMAAEAGAMNFARRLTVQRGSRPGTKAAGFRRPYARLIATLTDEEAAADSRARLTRRQILRRATRG